ncbi:MAG: type II secretion system F family protein [Deltaproteobacteria bacterium]|nr:type II secretion system F family protein [Deltaproteobacteria bacterium]
MANLIKGNVPILRALSLLAKQSGGEMGGVVTALRNSVRDGLSFSQAMERHPKLFPPLWIAMVRGGESAGVLGTMLEELADHEEKGDDLRRKVQGALVYPLVVLAMGVTTVFVLLTYFMPRLIGVYEGNQQKLPLPTALVLGISQFLSANWYWLLGGALLIAALVRRLGAGSRQSWWDGTLLKLPFLRDLTLKSSLIHFSRTLGLLLAHGVPLVRGVSLAAATVDNSVLRGQMAGLEEGLVKRGESLAATLKKIPQCPTMAIDLISVGEESGGLATSLTHIANTYERDVEALLKAFATLIEPVLILAIGSVIGFIVFAMLMPVFQMDVFVD